MHSETRYAIFSFWCTLKMTNFKIILGNKHPVLGRVPRKTQALIWNFLICISNTIKDQFRLFLFSKTWKYTMIEYYGKYFLRYQFTLRFCTYQNFVSWDYEIWVKTVSLTVKPWDLAGLVSIYLSDCGAAKGFTFHLTGECFGLLIYLSTYYSEE